MEQWLADGDIKASLDHVFPSLVLFAVVCVSCLCAIQHYTNSSDAVLGLQLFWCHVLLSVAHRKDTAVGRMIPQPF